MICPSSKSPKSIQSALSFIVIDRQSQPSFVPVRHHLRDVQGIIKHSSNTQKQFYFSLTYLLTAKERVTCLVLYYSYYCRVYPDDSISTEYWPTLLCLIRKQVSLALIDLCKFVCCIFGPAIIFDTMADLFIRIWLISLS